MSIVTLKKKSKRWQVPISGQGEFGFALNGTLRNYGSVGQTNLAKSVTRTPFRGNQPVGHGGCCGKYNVNISNSGNCSSNDNKVVKRSVSNTNGLINETLSFGRKTIQATPNFTGINEDLKDCQCPKNWVKHPLWNSQNEYILYRLIAKYAGNCGESKRITDFSNDKENRKCQQGDVLLSVKANICNSGIPGSNFIGTKRITNKYTIAKPSNNGVIDMGTYLRGLIYKKNCLPQINQLPYIQYNKMPDPAWLNQDKCGS